MLTWHFHFENKKAWKNEFWPWRRNLRCKSTEREYYGKGNEQIFFLCFYLCLNKEAVPPCQGSTFNGNCYCKQANNANNTNSNRKMYHSSVVCPRHVEFSWKSPRACEKTSMLQFYCHVAYVSAPYKEETIKLVPSSSSSLKMAVIYGVAWCFGVCICKIQREFKMAKNISRVFTLGHYGLMPPKLKKERRWCKHISTQAQPIQCKLKYK